MLKRIHQIKGTRFAESVIEQGLCHLHTRAQEKTRQASRRLTIKVFGLIAKKSQAVGA
jgi:hypothetical protein